MCLFVTQIGIIILEKGKQKEKLLLSRGKLTKDLEYKTEPVLSCDLSEVVVFELASKKFSASEQLHISALQLFSDCKSAFLNYC